MNAAAKAAVTEIPDITIAYGVSDEYRYPLSVIEPLTVLNELTDISFVLHKTSTLFERRARYDFLLV